MFADPDNRGPLESTELSTLLTLARRRGYGRAMAEESPAMGALEQRARGRLDRERILDAAQAIADADGVAKLTMRRIGAELGVDPTAVYRHFRDKNELLVELADRLFGIGPDVDPDLAWRDTLRIEMRYGMNRYRCHPDIARLLAMQPDDTPSLERIADRCLSLLREAGLTIEQAARFFQVIENHVVGTGLYYSLVESGSDRRLQDPDAMRRVYALLPAERFPDAVEASPHLFPDFDEAFDHGTDVILDAIERVAEGNTSVPPDDGAAP
jgi:AcrR family transcriptional regulator